MFFNAVLALVMSTNLSELVAALAAEDATQRAGAAEALSRMGPEAGQAAVPLIVACGDSSEQVREWAVAALEEAGPPKVSDLERLAALLSNQSPDVAFWAATLLGRLEADAGGAVPSLEAALSEDVAVSVRQRAAWALGKIGPPAAPALEALRRAASDADPRLARLAERAMGQIQR
jgi:HEAT repeat protein